MNFDLPGGKLDSYDQIEWEMNVAESKCFLANSFILRNSDNCLLADYL